MVKVKLLFISIIFIINSNISIFSQSPVDTLWTTIYKGAKTEMKLLETLNFEIDVMVFSSEVSKKINNPIEISGFFVLENLLSPYEETSKYFFIYTNDINSQPIYLDFKDIEKNKFERNNNKKIKVTGILRENDYSGKYQTGLWIENAKIIE